MSEQDEVRTIPLLPIKNTVLFRISCCRFRLAGPVPRRRWRKRWRGKRSKS